MLLLGVDCSAQSLCWPKAPEEEKEKRVLAFTRYCHSQYCMLYGMQKRGLGEGVHCAIVVQ